MGAEELEALREPIESGWITQGPKVAAFEKAFALRHGVEHAIATTSCTTALHLILQALELGPDDEVIVPSFTWVASANAVSYCGARPVLCDVDPITFNIDVEDMVRRVTPRTRAVIAVHLFGLCADMDAIRSALPDSVAIVEDAACAVGGMYRGKSAGALGHAAAFSFHPRKTITTGEGGMVTTNDASLAARIAQMRNHGASIPEEVRHRGAKPYLLPDFDTLGYNYRMTDLQAAVGLVQLGKLDAFIQERERRARIYAKAFEGVEWLRVPAVPADYRHAWQSYVVAVDSSRAPLSRDRIMERLAENGIAARPGTHAVHMLGYYRKTYGYEPGDLPGARECAANTMAIPLHNRMSDEDCITVADTIQRLGN